MLWRITVCWCIRAETASWIDTQLIDVRPEDVTSLTLSNSHGELALTRQNGSWAANEDGAEQRELDSAKVDAFLRSIGALRFAEPAGRIDEGREFGFDEATGRLELVFDVGGQGSEAIELIVGNEVEGQAGSRYAQRSGSKFAVVLDKTTADRLLDKKAEELLVETDAAGAEAGG